MELMALFEQIESVQFSTQVDIASGFRVFQRALGKNDFVQSLVKYLQEHPRHRQDVYQRLVELLGANEQPDYAHPFDPALAGYLHVLNTVDPALADLAAQKILQTPRLWWARKLANHVLQNRSTKTVHMNWGRSARPQPIFSSRDMAIPYEVKIARRQRSKIEMSDYQPRASNTRHAERMVS
jgi:hypothetical protein